MITEQKMKVLHLVARNIRGGAARGAYCLHQALREMGVDSFVMTNEWETLNDPFVVSLANTSIKRLKFSFLLRLGALPIRLYRRRNSTSFNTGFEGVNITKHVAYQSADIIHLHWINGLVSMRTLRKLNKPIVWTMRDMWPMTGGCHYSMDCDRYRNGCGRCPQLGSNFEYDLSALILANKKSSIPKKIVGVGISKWLSDCAKQSRIFADFDVRTISNNVDVKKFRPIERSIAKNILNIHTKKKIILLGAQKPTNYYKGFDIFLNSLKKFNFKDYYFLFFGKIKKTDLDIFGKDRTSLGFLTDEISLELAYSAADVFVAPSRMDAFGKTLAEAMACGTPVVCFDATGPKDIVDHKVTGYKAKPFDPEDLAKGILWVLNHSDSEYDKLSRQARLRAEKEFNSIKIAQLYGDLYLEMLSKEKI